MIIQCHFRQTKIEALEIKVWQKNIQGTKITIEKSQAEGMW